MGGAYISHPPLRPFEVHATANKHPITEGMKPFMVNDEQHYVIYDKDPKYVILEAENVDGLKFQDLGAKSVSGWAYDFGKGRVVFTAVGHTSTQCGTRSTSKYRRDRYGGCLRSFEAVVVSCSFKYRSPSKRELAVRT